MKASIQERLDGAFPSEAMSQPSSLTTVEPSADARGVLRGTGMPLPLLLSTD